MNQRWRVLTLWFLPIALVLLISWQIIGSPKQSKIDQGATTIAPRNVAIARIRRKIEQAETIIVCMSPINMGALNSSIIFPIKII